MSRFDYEEPRAPVCSDEEAQRLRDLWRPSVQADHQPLSWLDEDTRERKFRDKDFDTTPTSLWAYESMYVIPPAIAVPLRQELDEHTDGPFFDAPRGWEEGVMHGAKDFIRRFIPGWAFQPVDRDSCITQATAELEPKNGQLPHVGVDAQVLEREIPYELRQLIDGLKDDWEPGEDPYRYRTVTEHREGILGWTVPRWLAEPPHYYAGRSLLLAKNHLVSVGWYIGPEERLSLSFRYPQLTQAGEAAVKAALVELEDVIPEDTNYDELYLYHPRTSNEGSRRDRWAYTAEEKRQLRLEEQRQREQRNFDRGYSRVY